MSLNNFLKVSVNSFMFLVKNKLLSFTSSYLSFNNVFIHLENEDYLYWSLLK